MLPDSVRTLVVGDDAETVRSLAGRITRPVGYLAPAAVGQEVEATLARTDGGVLQGYENGWLGPLDRFGGVLSEFGTDAVVLAIDGPREQFELLETCAERGLPTFVPSDRAANVLLEEDAGNDELLAVDLEPWSRSERAVKRMFDVIFAIVGLLCLAPVMAAIALAIKLDSPGPVIYTQRRTMRFGRIRSVPKFRSMVEDAEAETGVTLSSENAGGTDDRVTAIGKVLRRTHLDELPQLWLILLGQMSVVGPRPERPELEAQIIASVPGWSQRWFVKPGLTGLAQIHDATSHSPAQKFEWDQEYVRHRSLALDCRIVARQIRIVLRDVRRLIER